MSERREKARQRGFGFRKKQRGRIRSEECVGVEPVRNVLFNVITKSAGRCRYLTFFDTFPGSLLGSFFFISSMPSWWIRRDKLKVWQLTPTIILPERVCPQRVVKKQKSHASPHKAISYRKWIWLSVPCVSTPEPKLDSLCCLQKWFVLPVSYQRKLSNTLSPAMPKTPRQTKESHSESAWFVSAGSTALETNAELFFFQNFFF